LERPKKGAAKGFERNRQASTSRAAASKFMVCVSSGNLGNGLTLLACLQFIFAETAMLIN